MIGKVDEAKEKAKPGKPDAKPKLQPEAKHVVGAHAS
jgi:hypothetical protein